MLREIKHLSKPERPRGAYWVALVALAWLQVSLASHQFDHAAGDFAESCHACVQLDRLDDVVADTHVAAQLLLPVDIDRQPCLHEFVGTRFADGFDARGPPQI